MLITLAYGTSNVSSVATSPAVASPALCGTPLSTTYLSQAMIIPNERTHLEVSSSCSSMTERMTDCQVGASWAKPHWTIGAIHVPPLLWTYQLYSLCLGGGSQHRRQGAGYGQVCE
jgi:hypothetical protein